MASPLQERLVQHLDRQVIEQALEWLRQGQAIWLCTVLSTYGSAPRAPGSMLVARKTGVAVGSLSGGCVEEDFLTRLAEGQFDHSTSVVRYGAGGLTPNIALPCGGVLDVLVEPINSNALEVIRFERVLGALAGQRNVVRDVNLTDGRASVSECVHSQAKVVRGESSVRILIGPTKRLLIAGLSPVADHCIDIALMLGHEVVVCEPRLELLEHARERWPSLQFVDQLPARFIEENGCHEATAVVALTHDPRLDDLTLLEAVRTNAYYIGAMGSVRTSEKRRERLARIGGMRTDELARIHAPIGLAVGSKSPAEIALSIMTHIISVANQVNDVNHDVVVKHERKTGKLNLEGLSTY
jgi:xanthine dehydrogenase accessory factor